MFGRRIDYQLLKPLTHRNGYATRAELEARSRASSFTLADAEAYLERVRTELFRGDLTVDSSLSYLDIGCGMGRLSLGLAAAGATDVTGVEIVDRNIVEATALAEKLLPEGKRPTFVNADIHNWDTDKKFDVIIVLGALEHIHDQDAFLSALPKYLAPNGRCFVSIEPFHSPFGDHMMHFFRVPVPWMGVLFNEEAVLQLRSEVFRPDDPASRYQDIEGGLNLVRYGEYVDNVRKAGLEFEVNHINPQLARRRRFLPARVVSEVTTRVPGLRDYFVVADYAVLRHKRSRSS